MSSLEDKYIHRRRRFSFLVVIAIIVLVFAGISEYRSIQDKKRIKDSSQEQTLPARTGSAREALGRLAVRESASLLGYSRSNYGDGWADIMGCDVRNLLLLQSLKSITLSDDGCVVLSGVLQNEPYNGGTINFRRGQGTSGDIQIDHVVALSDSWQKGAQLLSYADRVRFANDTLNLLAVDGGANQEKGGDDASEWLPRKEFRCRYVARQIAVKLKYDLWVSSQESNAMNSVLSSCPDQILPGEVKNE